MWWVVLLGAVAVHSGGVAAYCDTSTAGCWPTPDEWDALDRSMEGSLWPLNPESEFSQCTSAGNDAYVPVHPSALQSELSTQSTAYYKWTVATCCWKWHVAACDCIDSHAPY
eukprot:1189253-Prorocentrum_minimum.AAC.3